MLLDFNADLNHPSDKPPLTVAAKIGFYEGVKMLREKGAMIDENRENSLLAAVKSGSRECFAAMIEGQEHVVLRNIDSHSLSYHAIKNSSNLLPLIAYITEIQCEKQVGKMSEDQLIFPPKDISDKRDKQKFKTALDLQDHYLPYSQIKKELKHIMPVFNPVQESDAEANVEVEENKKESEAQYSESETEDNLEEQESQPIKQNNQAKKNKKNDSSAFLPQIPVNSASNYESYETAYSDDNNNNNNSNNKNNIMLETPKRKLSGIEEINVSNQKIINLSQDQLNKQQIPNSAFSSSPEGDDYLEEEEEEKENLEFETEEDEIEIEEEEEEAENTLVATTNVEYEYEEYEYDIETQVPNPNNIYSPQAAL